MKLTTYFRSTAAYRVRIALNHKNVDCELRPINLFAGEQKTQEFLAHNPEGLVPTLELDDETFTQSMAILEYLEETYPTPALLPSRAEDRMRVRAFAQTIVSDIHPLNNLRVLQYLVNNLGQDEATKLEWYHHWLKTGFDSIEKRLNAWGCEGQFCFGGSPSLADVCLIPQVYNANRFDFSLQAYPLISSINQHCLTLDAFAKARPETQIDYKT